MIEQVGLKCCGCSACANICPNNCITMIENEEGFLYPQVNQKLCVHCGLCENACPILQPQKMEDVSFHEAWGVTCKDTDLLMSSSSGGLFTLLAQEVLAQGGCVFGAAFSDDFEKVIHIMVTQKEELSLLRGSKYLQSEINTCYRQVKKELLSGRKVLFSGTPCQIAGLRSYLGRDYEDLFCVDIICHGTPSPKVWKAYLENVENSLGGKATFVSFRNKRKGWKEYGFFLEGGGNTYFRNLYEDPYLRMFINNYCIRESCYQCLVKELSPVSDITLGDFWGVNSISPELNNEYGVSIAIVHSDKGHQLLNSVLPWTDCGKTNFDLVIKKNTAYNHSVRCPKERTEFFTDLSSLDWETMSKKYGRDSVKIRFRRKLSASCIGRLKRRLLGI